MVMLLHKPIVSSKMGDKGEGGVKNLKKWVTSFMDGLLCHCLFGNCFICYKSRVHIYISLHKTYLENVVKIPFWFPIGLLSLNSNTTVLCPQTNFSKTNSRAKFFLQVNHFQGHHQFLFLWTLNITNTTIIE